MSLTLGGVSLPDLVADYGYQFGDSGIRSEFVVSRGAVPIIWEQEKFYRIFDLTGGERTGWAKHSLLLELRDLAKAQLDSNTFFDLVHSFDYNMLDMDGQVVSIVKNKTVSVRFRNWEQPVIEATPLVDVLVPTSDTLYNNVRIKLIEIIDPEEE